MKSTNEDEENIKYRMKKWLLSVRETLCSKYEKGDVKRIKSLECDM